MISDYDFEIDKIVEEIRSINAKKILIQLPDGLKPLATNIINTIKSKISTKIYIWAGSNFGACDFPSYLKNFNFDLIINFGHSRP